MRAAARGPVRARARARAGCALARAVCLSRSTRRREGAWVGSSALRAKDAGTATPRAWRSGQRCMCKAGLRRPRWRRGRPLPKRVWGDLSRGEVTGEQPAPRARPYDRCGCQCRGIHACNACREIGDGIHMVAGPQPNLNSRGAQVSRSLHHARVANRKQSASIGRPAPECMRAHEVARTSAHPRVCKRWREPRTERA